MKSIIGGVIGGISVLVVIILFSTQIDTAQEVITKQVMHPCQRVALDNFEFYKKNANLQFIPTGEAREQWEKEAENKLEQIKQTVIENDCENTVSEWVTEEFKAKLQVLWDKGF